MAHALHICLRAAAVCFSRHVSSSKHDLEPAGAQAWAYANLMFQPPCQLLDHLATAAQRSITKFSPQNTSNLVWCALVAWHKHMRALQDSWRLALICRAL